MQEEEKEKRIDEYAERLMRLAMDTMIVNMRFMDTAMGRLKAEAKKGIGSAAGDGEHFYYEPVFILRKYDEDANYITRLYLHSLFHCVFNHSFGYGKLKEELWDLSCDIAVENMIMELEVPAFSLADDGERMMRLKGLKKYVDKMTAEHIYKYFLANPPSQKNRALYVSLFEKDRHVYWKEPENLEMTQQDWKRISERIKAEIRSFSKNSGHSESLLKNLEEATREKQDYKRILERFCMRGESMSVSDEEFDYIYYTYGLEHYDRMPLIEPLEFKDEKKIRDFAIVLDTSASCRGDIVRSFLIRTYDIMKTSESFFKKINVHIIQCDSEIQQDTKITRQEDFDRFIKTGRLLGYGGTDFRPAFEYVDSLIEEGEFTDFKGLIYFTDGYGLYPQKKPEYECIFAFVNADEYRPSVPWWGTPVLLDDNELTETEE